MDLLCIIYASKFTLFIIEFVRSVGVYYLLDTFLY